MYEKPELVDGDLISVIDTTLLVSSKGFINHVCVGNGRFWCTRTTVSMSGCSDAGVAHYPPVDLTDLVKWDEAEGIFYIN